MVSWLWGQKEEATEVDQIQHVFNGIGKYNQEGALCEAPKFIGPNFGRLASSSQALDSFSSYSRTIPRDELKLAASIAPKAGALATDQSFLGLASSSEKNHSDDMTGSSIGTSGKSKLKLKAQYIFNIFEEVDNSDTEEKEVTQHVSNSLIPPVRRSSKKLLSSSPQLDFYSLLKNFLAIALIYFVYFLATSFWHDYSVLVNEEIRANNEKYNRCSADYSSNDCFNPDPLLVELCDEWSKCIRTDPHSVEKTTLAVKLLARLISTFINALTFREMSLISLCTFTVLMGSLVVRNLFGGHK